MSQAMKHLTITLVGTVTYGATRSFVLEVPDDVNPATLDPHVLEDLADRAQIAWSFDNEGFVLMTDHVVDDTRLGECETTLPVISSMNVVI